jgi:uncharacterized protein YaiI (UPF0178 family)
MTPEIYIDADACPVKEEALKVAYRHDLVLHLVSNQWLRLDVGENIRKVVVPGNFDAADDWIVENIRAGDICVTGDIPLASRALEKGALVMGHGGRLFTAENIGMALAMRELKSQLRDMGEDRGFNASFSQKDRSRFLSALEQAVQEAFRRP